MGRPNKPRYREERDAWVTKINGQLVTLARGRRSRREAMAELARRLDCSGSGPVVGPGLTVGRLASLWTADVERRVSVGRAAAVTVEGYLGRLRPLLAAHGDLPVRQLTPSMVEAVADRDPSWSETTRWKTRSVARTMTRWARLWEPWSRS